MGRFSIGVISDTFGLSLKEGISVSKKLGASGIQIYAPQDELSLELTKAERKEILDFIKSEGLVVSAICGQIPGHGLCIAQENPAKIKSLMKVLELTMDLECNIVTTHIGVIPEDKSDPTWGVMLDACKELSEHASGLGACYAIETGPEKATVLKEFLDNIPTKGMKVNFDPANMVMVTDDDPVKGVHTLKDYIVHTHAKDGIMNKYFGPDVVYNAFAVGGVEALLALEGAFTETPIGQGNVRWNEYLKALDDIGFNGFLTIEREGAEDPQGDVKIGIDFLKKKLAELSL